LPELVLIEGNQLVATKRDESLSPSLFTFRSHFVTIHHDYYYVFMTFQYQVSGWSPSHLRVPEILTLFVPEILAV